MSNLIESMVKWWTHREEGRIPLPGRIAEYGSYKRVLVSRAFTNTGGTLDRPMDPYRVALSVYSNFIPNPAADSGLLTFLDSQGNILIRHAVYSKQVDVALATPAPALYNPFRETVLTWGQMITNRYQVVTASSNCFVVETVLVSSL